MLTHVSSKDNLSLRIMGIDPGTRSLGLALGVCDFKTPAFNIEFGETFNIEKITHKSNLYLAQNHSRNIAMTDAIYEAVTQMIHDLQPDLIICESPYMDRRFPLAYMLLSLCVEAIQKAVRDYSTFIPFELIDPASAKNGVNVSGGSRDKLDMRRAVLSMNTIRSQQDLMTKDEHTIDAIAIAYNGFLGVLNA